VTRPDYQGGGIVNLMASIIAGCDGLPSDYPTLNALPPGRVARHRNVVLLVIDALGYEFLVSNHAGSRLAEHCRTSMTSVFPPTTATAITTYLTGLAPQQHAVTGWFTFFRELGSVLAILPYRARFGGATLADAGIDLASLLQPQPVFDRLPVASHNVLPRHIAHSPFNLAHAGRATIRPCDTLHTLFSILKEIIEETTERNYIYAYWPGLDAIGHVHGMGSAAAARHFHEIDRNFSGFLNAIRGTDTLVVATADHGQVDAAPRERLELEDHPDIRRCLTLPLCGESRAAYAYVHAGMEAQFENAVARALGDALTLRRSKDVLESGYFGCGEPHPCLADRIGDYVMLMNGHYTLRDRLLGEESFDHVGSHGGTSDAELFVPLIVAEP
jgi:hypothetical protein